MTDLQLSSRDGAPVVSGPRYRLTTSIARPFVELSGPLGEQIAELFVGTSAHSSAGQDDTTAMGPWEVSAAGDTITLSRRAQSSVWAEKTFSFHCTPERIRYEVRLSGRGYLYLSDVEYFGGYYSGALRWGSGRFSSGQHFLQGFTPEPNTDERTRFSAAEGATIDITGVPLPGRDGWFFTPPPFCFAFEHAGGWLGLGVEADPGGHQFSEYRYHGSRGAFALSLGYEGQTLADGDYTLPAIGFDFADSPYAALASHCASARARLGHPRPAAQAAWWRAPIFCGWGAHGYLASLERGRHPDYARQEHYERFLATLERHRLDPGIVVIDDKWQAAYGTNAADSEKWPDLPGFVAAQHRRGRRVLLWLKLWDPEGLPADECVRNAAGLPIAADPTSPAYEARLRASVRQMLGPDGYDADGFKIDFSARVPSGPGLRRYGTAWGLELMRRCLEIIYDEAKRSKPDALVMSHTPHPYLADITDMVRLNDVNTGSEIITAMRHRARVARLACPEALIDTDNWPVKNRASWRSYLRAQEQLGIPSLYYVDHIDSTGEPLEEEDYALLREIWGRLRPSAAEAPAEATPAEPAPTPAIRPQPVPAISA